MAQKQFINFKDPVDSLPLAEKDMGLMRPGRYSGFDIGTIVGTTLELTHSNKIQKVDDSGNLVNFGSFKTPKGIIIHEDQNLTLTIPSIGSGSYYGIVIAEHNYQPIIGGNDANYQIIVGPGPDYPNIPDPTKQCIIGFIRGGGSIVGDIEVLPPYSPAPAPLPGDGDMAAYLETIPYATLSTPGLVKLANLSYQGNDPYNNTTTYISPANLRASGVNHIINIGILNSGVPTPGWVTQEITTQFAGQFYKLQDIKEYDIIYEETSGAFKYYRSMKAGVYPVSSLTEGVGYPEPVLGLPQLRVDLTNNKAFIQFYSKLTNNINNAQLIINRVK